MLVYVLVAEETVYVVLVQVAQEGCEDAATQTVPMQTDGAIQDDAEHVIEDEVGVDVLRGVGDVLVTVGVEAGVDAGVEAGVPLGEVVMAGVEAGVEEGVGAYVQSDDDVLPNGEVIPMEHEDLAVGQFAPLDLQPPLQLISPLIV